MTHTHETARKSTGPKGVPRHQLASRNEGASSSSRPSPSDMSREDLIAKLEQLQTDHKIVVKDRYQCDETLGEYQEENEQLKRTIVRLKTKVGRLHGEKGELQGEMGHLQRQNEDLGNQVDVVQGQLQQSVIAQRDMQHVLNFRTDQRNEAWARENDLRNQVHMLEFHVDQVELWSDHLHGEVHRLTNLMDPDYLREAVAGDLGMVDNDGVEQEEEEESKASAAVEEEGPEPVVPANDDGDHDDMDDNDDA